MTMESTSAFRGMEFKLRKLVPLTLEYRKIV